MVIFVLSTLIKVPERTLNEYELSKLKSVSWRNFISKNAIGISLVAFIGGICYSTVLSYLGEYAAANGMGEIGGRIGAAIVTKIAEGSNAQVAALNTISNQIAYVAPAMASGTIVPYAITKADLTDLAQSIEASHDEMQSAMIQAILQAANMIVSAVQAIDTSTTIDDNMVARRTIDEINRRTIMFSASPLK